MANIDEVAQAFRNVGIPFETDSSKDYLFLVVVGSNTSDGEIAGAVDFVFHISDGRFCKVNVY